MARALGLAVSTVAVAAARGMPMTSVSDAQRWREEHVRLYRKPPAGTANLTVPETGPEPPADNGQSSGASIALEGGNGKDDGHLGDTLARLRRLERALVAAIEESLSSKDVARTVVLRREHTQVVKALFDSESKLLSILRVRSKLITVDEAQRCLSAVLAPIAVELRSLPAHAASPEERTRLEAWAGSLLAKVRDGITEGFNGS